MMTLSSIKTAISAGQKVCWKTSRYEVLLDNNKLYERDVYNGSMCGLTEESAQHCFIKTDWND